MDDDQELTEEEVAALDAEQDEPEPATSEADGETPGEEAAEPAPDPAQLESYARMEEIGKKLDGVTKYVARKMGEILGDDVTLFEQCEICSYSNTPGWRPSGPLPPEVIANVRHAMGEHAPSDYMKDSYARGCEKCNGLGETLSGSKVAGRELVTCVDCQGRGWVPVGSERASGATAVPNGPSPAYPDYAAATADLGAPVGDEPPEVAALKAKGYSVISPFRVNG